MASSSSIEWTDTTWNPIVGCSMCSPGCAYCYAETMARRLRAMALGDIDAGRDPGRKRHYIDAVDEHGRWTGKLIPVPEALTDPLHWKKPRRVFVNSMSDLFHEDVPFDFVDQVFAVMALCPQHTFQVLTKRPERMAKYLSTRELAVDIDPHMRALAGVHQWPDDVGDLEWPLPNVWLCTSTENQATADARVPWLLKCPATVHGLSIEPLLREIDLRSLLSTKTQVAGMESAPVILKQSGALSSFTVYEFGPPFVDWAILGCESKNGSRAGRFADGFIDAAIAIVEQCRAAGVAVFVKQIPHEGKVLHRNPDGTWPDAWPLTLRFQEWPAATVETV